MNLWMRPINKTCRELQLQAFELWNEAIGVDNSYPAMREHIQNQAKQRAFDADTHANKLSAKSHPNKWVVKPKKI